VDNECSRLVGKSVGEFLRRAERIKVILLHSPSKFCPSCEEVLQRYSAFAEENFSVGEVAFGHFDTLLNDHPVIHDEKTPSLLIFLDKNFQNPFELAADSLDYLRTFIQKTLNKKPKRDPTEKREDM
jgi:thiol-disulfide isomerase/thioredoxin